MSDEGRIIPQRELRNNIGEVLREVASGKRVTVTVRGKPVAELVPIEARRVFVPSTVVAKILAKAPLDDDFSRDVAEALGGTVDEL